MAAKRKVKVVQGRIRCWNHGQGPPQAPCAGWKKSQYPALGKTRHLKPNAHCRINPIQTTGALIAISTKTMAARSPSDLGLSAEKIPIGSATSIQRTAPPNTIEAVTGASVRIVCVTSTRFVNDLPSE